MSHKKQEKVTADLPPLNAGVLFEYEIASCIFAIRKWNMKENRGIILVGIHDIGSSALTFAAIAEALATYGICVVAPDLRHHGASRSEASVVLDPERLYNDMKQIIHQIIREMEPHGIILLGHGIGGVVAAKILPGLNKLKAIVVVNAFESSGYKTACKFVDFRKMEFSSNIHAIACTVNQDIICNARSADISVPPLYKRNSTTGALVPIHPICSTKVYWRQYFAGFTDALLNCPVPKLLISSSDECLDRNLSLAFMQRRFILCEMIGSGYFLHEDNPVEVAKAINSFLLSFKISQQS